MSSATIEHDLEQYLQHTGYEVTFDQRYEDFEAIVIFNAHIIARKMFTSSPWLSRPPSYPKASKRALGVIKDHQKAMRALGGLVRT